MINQKFGKNFLWCRVAKASSTSWVKLFASEWFENIEPFMGCPREGEHRILDKELLIEDRHEMIDNKLDEQIFSFITTRHPFDRILSAYR